MQVSPLQEKDPIVLTVVDALVIIAPLLLFLFILFLNGDVDSIFRKAEWSFVTVFYLVEVLRDQVKRQRLEGYHEDQAESGVVFFSIILSIGVLILFADFRSTITASPLPGNVFPILKFSAFTLSLCMFLFYRYRKHKSLITQPATD